MKRRLVISFSGGETSAFMTLLIIVFYRHLYDEIVIIFANTGQENEETLEFVDQCDRLLFAPHGYRVTYVEAVQNHGKRKRASARVVTFETANRDGAVFEDMIKKYGIPNVDFPHCTRDLKLAPIWSYCEMIGWPIGSYDTAIGIRADEIDRMTGNGRQKRVIYPLISWFARTKRQINTWWNAQAFRLRLKGYQGNCKWCWKKSERKLFTLMRERPADFEFPRRMEQQYAFVGPEFKKPDAIERIAKGYKRSFFRSHQTTDDLFSRNLTLIDFLPSDDDSVVYDIELDAPGGCGESCEVFSDAVLSSFDEDE